tara:strand:+ start:442 stop:1077 length:636 start_codon:yes stop_codon:yes gene_type:complete
MFSQDNFLIGDVDCNSEINSEDASLILQFVTNVIDELPCQENMNGLTPDQLESMINMINEQVNVNTNQSINMIGPMYLYSQFPEFEHALLEVESSYIDDSNLYYWENRLNFLDAIRFCRDLEYDGYSDWYLPKLTQLIDYVENVSDVTIANNTDVLTLFTNPDGYFNNSGQLVFHTMERGQLSPETIYYPQFSNGMLSGVGGSRYHCFCVR